MTLDPTNIDRLAQLAGIDLEPQHQEQLCQQISNILDLVDTLQKTDTHNIQPLAHPMELTQLLREDVITEGDTRAHLFDNAPLCEDSLFLVPKVIEIE